MRQAVLCAAAVSLGLLAPGERAAAQSDLPDKVYDWVIQEFRAYRELPEPKVLVACVEWNRATPPPVFVHNVFATYSGPGSDRPIFLTQLESDALHRCQKWQKEKDTDCTCQALDRNGKNVLRAPK